MKNLLKTNIGRLRIMGFLEGVSLLILIFIGMPMKYLYESPGIVKSVGPAHGGLFVVFVIYAVMVGVEYKWKFLTTSLVVLSSFVPFGTFYVDKKILSKVTAKAE